MPMVSAPPARLSITIGWPISLASSAPSRRATVSVALPAACGTTIVITGAASGIGRATALIFAREGANVVCADINEDGARETAGAIMDKGGQTLVLRTDVTSRGQVDEMARCAVDTFGTVQFLF